MKVIKNHALHYALIFVHALKFNHFTSFTTKKYAINNYEYALNILMIISFFVSYMTLIQNNPVEFILFDCIDGCNITKKTTNNTFKYQFKMQISQNFHQILHITVRY